MSSVSAYHLTWVSLTLDVRYLFMAAPEKCSCCSLPWMWDISSKSQLLTLGMGYLLSATAPDLGCGVIPLADTPDLGCGVAPLSHSCTEYVNREHPDVQAGFRKGRGTREKIENICWMLEKEKEFQKKHLLLLCDYAKAFDCVDHNKVWEILKEMGIPDHLTCLFINLYSGQEATFRTEHGKTDWFQIGKGVRQGCILSPCLFNLYAECIMRNAGLEETQAGIKIAGRNINNLRYADDTTLMKESEEELKRTKKPVDESERGE